MAKSPSPALDRWAPICCANVAVMYKRLIVLSFSTMALLFFAFLLFTAIVVDVVVAVVVAVLDHEPEREREREREKKKKKKKKRQRDFFIFWVALFPVYFWLCVWWF